jgi:transposase InsO family protein
MGGGGYKSNEFMNFSEMHGIKRQYIKANIPQQNGVVKRKNITLIGGFLVCLSSWSS